MVEVTKEKQEKVIEVLEQNGYTNPEYLDFLDTFEFSSGLLKFKFCKLEYKENQFLIVTISNYWDTNAIDEYIKELQEHNKLAKELNEILQS